MAEKKTIIEDRYYASDNEKMARIIKAANELLAATLDAGLSIESTSGVSGFDINIYDHRVNEIDVHNILSHWRVSGALTVDGVTFKKEGE